MAFTEVTYPFVSAPATGVSTSSLLTASGNIIAILMSPPGTPSLVIAGGGTLVTSSTYYYKVTALDGQGGETTASVEASILITGGNSVTLTWTTVPGATTYRIYRGTTAGGESAYQSVTATATVTQNFTDTGAAGTAGTPPASPTAYAFRAQPALFTTGISGLFVTLGWNAAGVVFPGALLVNVEDIASAAGSLLLDLQDSGVSKFKVDKTGALTL